ncbi:MULTISPECIES: M56 family metallopeptidase [unclassified Enterococcus]|uniref:M56 family metallopeptidase n=1 Tax=unclassified Enterococcus TaxID=2608891 RepID=UPI0015543D12|nr:MULTISPECIES: M56 family metallopeptidase [unclassified Enterococcus]MBS7578439.1 M56 family metallopeptidase [Enterococcus sp. MMGLQ5-2]MBS7585670.1 M56 family metallopeptidase [Enterococcus sp. MMGLQ5-1]NPD13529.1 M56 family metallopeptidase [Enterococcus sp. MMGLQ5-1]NPD38271.1 M56 family metallopeptidase [Enterococcus sp. MMGLQ5-2]
MVRLSISSLLISSLSAILLIVILNTILKREKTYSIFRSDFLNLFYLIILIRLFFPVELLNTITVPSLRIVPAIYRVLQYQVNFFGTPITVYQLIGIVWLLGAIVFFIRLIINTLKLNRLIQNIKSTSKQLSTKRYISSNTIPIYVSSSVDSPLTSGLVHPIIIIPDHNYSDLEIYNVLLHELQHIKNKDVAKKYIIEILTCIYWWLPFIYLLRNQISLIIELNVDSQVTEKMSSEDYFDYMNSLVSVQEKSRDKQIAINNQAVAAYFTNFHQTTLSKRIEFLFNGFKRKKTNKIVLALLLVSVLIVTSFIFEPKAYNEKLMHDTFVMNEKTSQYILKTKDNQYFLYFNGKNMGTIDNINDPSLKGIPIKEE